MVMIRLEDEASTAIHPQSLMELLGMRKKRCFRVPSRNILDWDRDTWREQTIEHRLDLTDLI